MASHLPKDEMPTILHGELSDLEAIGQGGFGVAYRAKHAQFGTVVYKELNVQILGDRISRELSKEAQMHTLDHINIVALHAIISEPGHYGIVMEYVPYGALDEYIVNNQVGWPRKLSFAHDIVCGMSYLHSRQPPVIHSDLKSENVLISDRLVAKICDFGLTKWKRQPATQTTLGKRRGTVAYMAPEVFRDANSPRTVKYDVYSFGILLWEIGSVKKPFENAMNNDEHIRTAVMNGNRPALDEVTGPAYLVSSLKRCITQSWHESPEERPSFDDLKKMLTDTKANMMRSSRRYRADLVRRRIYTLRRRVVGVTTMNNKIFVVYYMLPFIVVYMSQEPYARLPDIPVNGLKEPFDIAAGRSSLHVIDNLSIWQVAAADNKVTQWLSGVKALSVSVMSDEKLVLLVVFDVQGSWKERNATWQGEIHIYSQDAVRECVIKLSRDITTPHSVAITSRNTFIVSHGYLWHEMNRVCEVDMAGHTLKVYGSLPGGNVGQLKLPFSVSLDEEEQVIVADTNNNRLLLLNKELMLQQVLLTWRPQLPGNAKYPRRLHYDSHSGRLLVGFYSGHLDIYQVAPEFAQQAAV